MKELLLIAAECYKPRFTEDMTNILINFQPVKFSSKLYSKEYIRKFEIPHSTATVEEPSQQKGKL